MWGSAVSVMRRARPCCAVLALLLLSASGAGALPAEARLDEREAVEAEAALDQVVDSIRERLMRELGITHNAPVLNSTEAEMEEVMEQYRNAVAEMERKRQQDEWEDEFDEDSPLESYHSVIDEGWLRTRTHRSVSLRTRTASGLTSYFPLEEAGLGAHEYVQGATLRLYLQLSAGAAPADVRLSVYRLTGGGSSGRRPRRVRLLAQRLRITASGWHELNVTSTAQQWQARPERNHGLQVECGQCASGGVRLTGGSGPRRLAPRLVLRTRTVRRTKRNSGFLGLSRGKPHGCKGGRRSKCCRQEMFVDFDELGDFDFIITPRNFSAYYCRGRCPPSYNPATDHALLQGWIYQKWKREQRETGGRKTPPVSRTCCVPSKLTALPIAYTGEDGKPHFRLWEDVVAEECKCS